MWVIRRPATGGVPGQKVRLKIRSSSGQIKALTQGIHPGLLVLYEGHFAGVNIEPYNIQVAMYGLETFDLAVPESGPPYLLGARHGPRQKMTQQDNTSISAIATLQRLHTGQIIFAVYHNKYAAVPLPLAIFAQYRVHQFTLWQPEASTFPRGKLYANTELLS